MKNEKKKNRKEKKKKKRKNKEKIVDRRGLEHITQVLGVECIYDTLVKFYSYTVFLLANHGFLFCFVFHFSTSLQLQNYC